MIKFIVQSNSEHQSEKTKINTAKIIIDSFNYKLLNKLVIKMYLRNWRKIFRKLIRKIYKMKMNDKIKFIIIKRIKNNIKSKRIKLNKSK